MTSYVGLFGDRIHSVEIPRIQRDYAQGREDAEARRVRSSFLGVLVDALTTGKEVSLDFVYGDVSDGTFTPLDGQQRLTTLFLLHWYLAARVGRLEPLPRWARFTYETRPGARLFCQRLGSRARPFPLDGPVSAWLRDQPWFMSDWKHDPTIGAMLVMIDAIHDQLGSVDAEVAWARLTDPDRPVISFHLLDIEKLGLTDELYIKMNARGKPLTEFEHFKALFQEHVDAVAPEMSSGLAEKLDGAWAELLWPYRGVDRSSGDADVTDEELLRYFDFVTETLAWAEGVDFGGGRIARSKRIFSGEEARRRLEWLSAAFDTWHGVGISEHFHEMFVDEGHTPGKLTLFGRRAQVDLFASCCGGYTVGGRGDLRGALLLYGVLVHRLERTPEFERRLRALRNLLEASEFQVRAEAMPQLVAATGRLVRAGVDADLSGFLPSQVAEERTKAKLLASHPELRGALEALEDHPLLRGTLAAVDLDPERLVARAETFRALFLPQHYRTLTAALLACGDYSQWSPDRRFYYFGARQNDEPWRNLFARNRPGLDRTRAVVTTLLDRVGAHTGSIAQALDALREGFLDQARAERRFDWRYHLVARDVMREGDSGIYAVAPKRMGYDACMLRKTQMKSYYRDPWLHAMRTLAAPGDTVEDSWFYGYEHEPRWMVLPRSGVRLRCVPEGLRVEGNGEAFAGVCASFEVRDGVLLVEQVDGVDTEDRVVRGAELIRALVAAGL